MKTEEELKSMDKTELIEFAKATQFQLYLKESVEKENERLKKILSAIGLIFEAYLLGNKE